VILSGDFISSSAIFLLNYCSLRLNASTNIFVLMLYYLYLALAFYIHIGKGFPLHYYLFIAEQALSSCAPILLYSKEM